MSVWQFFAFLTMEVFKLYGYDCMFGGLDYLSRLILVTTVPLLLIFLLSTPWLATFVGIHSHRRSKVFDQFTNSALWVVCEWPASCSPRICSLLQYLHFFKVFSCPSD